MITCTRCGEKSPDDALSCAKCGKKLQSARAPEAPKTDYERPVGRFEHQGITGDAWSALMRMLEAWVYILILAGVAAGCAWFRTWWPLYGAVPLLALIAWLRRI